jgi:hypothetical protein
MFDGFNEKGYMRLVNGDFSAECGRPRSGTVGVLCAKDKSVFVYEYACEYHFTVTDPDACSQRHFRGAHFIGSHDSHYASFGGERLAGRKATLKTDEYLYEVVFFDKLTRQDHDGNTVILGHFDGVDPFHKRSVVLSHGEFCPEAQRPWTGLLMVQCSPTSHLQIKQVGPCSLHAVYYDDSNHCQVPDSHIW